MERCARLRRNASMNHLRPLVALLLVSACDQAERPAAPAPTVAKAPVPAPVKAAVPSLKGQWHVTTPATLDLTIGDGQATLSSGCLRRGFTSRQNGNQVTFTSSPAGSSNCGRTPSLAEETAFAALADANLAVFSKDGRDVTLSGFGGVLALERR